MLYGRSVPRLPYIALAYAMGILVGSTLLPFVDGQIVRPLVITYLALGMSVVVWRGGPKWSQVLSITFLIGCIRVTVEHRSIEQSPFYPFADDRIEEFVVGTVLGPVEHTLETQRFKLETILPARGIVWTTVQRPGPSFAPGERLAIAGRLHLRPRYQNPGYSPWTRRVATRNADAVLRTRANRISRAGKTFSLWKWPDHVHARLSQLLFLPDTPSIGSAFVRAMVVGDRSSLDPQILDGIRTSGISHVLAVSGLHLAVITMLVFWLAKRIWGLIPGAAIFASPMAVAAYSAWMSAVAYTLITGAKISTLRALLVVSIVLFGVATARRAHIFDALGWAAMILLTLNPVSLFAPSFQLSFAATFTLAIVMTSRVNTPLAPDPSSPQTTVLKYTGRKLADVFRASCWASFATAPFTALSFSTISTAGLIANVVAVPIVELIILPFGFFGVLLSLMWRSAGTWLITAACHVADILVHGAMMVATWFPALPVFPPRWWELALFGVLWATSVGYATRVGKNYDGTDHSTLCSCQPGD